MIHRLARVLLALTIAPTCLDAQHLDAQHLDVQQGMATGAEVTVEHDAASRENTYRISSGDCRITWTVYGTETNRGVVRHRCDCGRPLGEQAPLIGLVLRKVLASEGDSWILKTLSWGRLYGDGAKDATMSARLAAAARRSAGWDAVAGKPKGGDLNGWVRKLGRDSDIAAELRQVFTTAGLELEISSVEKVLVERAGRLPFHEILLRQGVRPTDKVPFDCQLWFSVRGKGSKPQ